MEERYEKRGYLLEDFRLFHLQDARGVKTEYHYHEFCKLLLLLSGSGSYTVEGDRYPLSPGDLVLLDSHCIHRSEFEPGRPYERIILYISPELLRRSSSEDCQLTQCFSGEGGPVLRLPDAAFQRLKKLTAELEQELSGNHYGRTIASNSLLLRLLVEVGRCQQGRSARFPKPDKPGSPLIRGVLTHIEEHLEQELNIDLLAEEFYVSKFHLMRQFRQETGSTIHGYITERRLFLARDLIAQGMASTEACFHAGFGSYSSFSRAYNKLFGATPTGRAVKSAEDVLDE